MVRSGRPEALATRIGDADGEAVSARSPGKPTCALLSMHLEVAVSYSRAEHPDRVIPFWAIFGHPHGSAPMGSPVE